MYTAFSSAVCVPIASFGAAGILMNGLDSTVWQQNGHCEPHMLEGKLVLKCKKLKQFFSQGGNQVGNLGIGSQICD